MEEDLYEAEEVADKSSLVTSKEEDYQQQSYQMTSAQLIELRNNKLDPEEESQKLHT